MPQLMFYVKLFFLNLLKIKYVVTFFTILYNKKTKRNTHSVFLLLKLIFTPCLNCNINLKCIIYNLNKVILLCFPFYRQTVSRILK